MLPSGIQASPEGLRVQRVGHGVHEGILVTAGAYIGSYDYFSRSPLFAPREPPLVVTVALDKSQTASQ